jgi:uncharacterized membrane protein
MQHIREVIDWLAFAIELLAVAIIVSGVLMVAVRHGMIRYIFRFDEPGANEIYKREIGRRLLLGLDLLVSADVIRTVAVEPTLGNVASLGLLSVVRTFIVWSLAVEMDGRWPWQRKPEPES